MAKKSSDKDIITQALLLGFGLMDATKDKVEKLIDNVKKDRNITKKESDKVAKDFLKSIEKTRKEVQKTIRKQVKKVVDELGAKKKTGKKKK